MLTRPTKPKRTDTLFPYTAVCRSPLARPMLFIWLMVYLSALVRGLISIGWMPQNSVTLYGFQAGLAFAAFLLSLAMADQVMEFRKQRDRALGQQDQGIAAPAHPARNSARILARAPEGVEAVRPLDRAAGILRDPQAVPRSEERRGGKGCVSTCRSRWS